MQLYKRKGILNYRSDIYARKCDGSNIADAKSYNVRYYVIDLRHQSSLHFEWINN